MNPQRVLRNGIPRDRGAANLDLLQHAPADARCGPAETPAPDPESSAPSREEHADRCQTAYSKACLPTGQPKTGVKICVKHKMQNSPAKLSTRRGTDVNQCPFSSGFEPEGRGFTEEHALPPSRRAIDTRVFPNS